MITKEMRNGRVGNVGYEVVSEAPPVPGANGKNGQSVEDEIVLGEAIDEQELKSILEAILFMSHDPITIEKLVTVVEGPSKADVHQSLIALKADYDQEGRGLRIAEVAGGFVMVTRPDCGVYIKRLAKSKPIAKLSRSALETLAIISYKQPIIRAEIEKIRGVETSGVLRTLLDHKLVRIVGRQDVPGRPILYGTSKQFLQRFGLRDLRDLPPLKEFQALGDPESPSLPFEEGVDLENSNGTHADPAGS